MLVMPASRSRLIARFVQDGHDAWGMAGTDAGGVLAVGDIGFNGPATVRTRSVTLTLP